MRKTTFGLMAGAALAAMSLLAGVEAQAAAPTYKITGKIAGGDGGWDYATFDPGLRRFYLSHAGGVFVVDVDTGKVIEKLADAPGGHKVVPLDGGKRIAVTVASDTSLRFFDAQTGALLGSAPTGTGPDAAMYDETSGLVLVAAHRGAAINLIDPKTMKSVGSIPVAGVLEEIATDGSGRAFVNIENTNELVAVDLKSKVETARVKLTGCDGPTGLVYAQHAHALVASCDGAAVVVNAKTLKVEATLPIGKGPDAALYDPIRKLVIIPCGQSAEISVIDASTPGKLKVVGSYASEKGARTGALDPKTGKVYMAAAESLPPEPGQKRGKMKPGSFHIVVMSPSH